MKKLGILVIALGLLVVGLAMAEPGINQTNEVQGLSISTTVIAAGNFNAASSVQVTSIGRTDTENLDTIPPLDSGVYYTSLYTEDTQNSDVGYISYDKDLDVTTANRISGQYNVQAVKQITYVGVDASSIITNDYMLLDGAGTDYGTMHDALICPFGSDQQGPAFCNRIETGSNMNLKVANLNTQMGERFIMKSADPGVAVYNNVGVGAYTADLPSQGSVSAYIQGSIKEGGRATDTADDLTETVVFKDSTGVSGVISTFAKSMSYTSAFA
jgi:hypothetical protein